MHASIAPRALALAGSSGKSGGGKRIQRKSRRGGLMNLLSGLVQWASDTCHGGSPCFFQCGYSRGHHTLSCPPPHDHATSAEPPTSPTSATAQTGAETTTGQHVCSSKADTSTDNLTQTISAEAATSESASSASTVLPPGLPHEFSLRELADGTRGFAPGCTLSMDWAGAVYRACCHVGLNLQFGAGTPANLRCGCSRSNSAASTRDSAKRGVSKRGSKGKVPAGELPVLCCCSRCRQLSASECVTVKGGCTRVKRWRSLLPAADVAASGRSSRSGGSTAGGRDDPHAEERRVMVGLARAAATHDSLLPVVGFCCDEEMLLVFRSESGTRSLESALAKDALVCGADKHSSLASFSTRLSIAHQMTSAVAHLHAHSFLHGSLRPSNVLLSAAVPAPEAAGQVRVQLADYGLPWQARDGRGLAGKRLGGVVFGKAAYLDPAFLASGRFSDASDVYSLGLILKELILRPSLSTGAPSRRIRTSLSAVSAVVAPAPALPTSRSEPGTNGVYSPPLLHSNSPLSSCSSSPADLRSHSARKAEPEPSVTGSAEADDTHQRAAAQMGPVRFHQATALVQWCTERNPAKRPSSSEVEQLIMGMEKVNVVGDLRRREMGGRRLRGKGWGLLSRTPC